MATRTRDGISIGANALDANGATIVSTANGVAASLSHSGKSPAYTQYVDGVPPMLTEAAVPGSGRWIELSFDEHLDTANPPAAGAFAVTADGVSVAFLGVFVADGNVLLTPLSRAIARGQSVTVTYTDPSGGDDTAAVQDALGNDTPSFTTGEGGVPGVVNNSTVDRTPPMLTEAAVPGSGRWIELSFDEHLDTANPPAAGAFAVTADGVSVAFLGVFVADGNVLLTPLSRAIARGQSVTVTYTDPSGGDDTAAVQDALGNDTPSFTTGEGGVPGVVNNSTVDRTPPMLTEAAVPGSGRWIELSFDEHLDTANPPAAGAFAVTADGVSVAFLGVFVADGNVLLTPLSRAIARGQSVTVTYTDPSGGDDTAAVQGCAGQRHALVHDRRGRRARRGQRVHRRGHGAGARERRDVGGWRTGHSHLRRAGGFRRRRLRGCLRRNDLRVECGKNRRGQREAAPGGRGRGGPDGHGQRARQCGAGQRWKRQRGDRVAGGDEQGPGHRVGGDRLRPGRGRHLRARRCGQGDGDVQQGGDGDGHAGAGAGLRR